MQKQSLKLLEHAKEVIDSYDFALTLRQIYYQLVVKQIIANLQKYYMKLSRLCVLGRDEGLLPEDAFADRLRQVDKPPSWVDLPDFMDTVKEAYKKDLWQNQTAYLEIWTEKDALRGVISPITYENDVPLLIVRGQVSRTAIHESYERFAGKLDKGLDCYLYYFGDFDPSGLSIYNSLVERITAHGEAGQYINFERIALTPEQIKKYKLPSDPAKQKDPNYKNFVSQYGDKVVELDALPPNVLRSLVINCISSKRDSKLLAQIQKNERKEQARLQKLVGELRI